MKRTTPRSVAAKLRRFCSLEPKLAIILGTGFGDTLRDLEAEQRVPYHALAGFPSVGVAGHRGELVIGRLAGAEVIVLRGRAHFYEGHPMSSVTFPVRVLAAFGVQDLLLTNAAGGINPRFRPGDFMALEDHLNFMGANPLRGEPIAGLPQFVDLSRIYDPGLRALLIRAGRKSGIRLRTGVYVAVSGPSYETPAEIQALRKLGADAVGMSTVPEAIVARQCGLRVAAVSCITNQAAGLGRKPLTHSEVLGTAARVHQASGTLLTCFAHLYGQADPRPSADAPSRE